VNEVYWGAEVGFREKEWDAEQVPDKKVAWRNTTGAPNAGVVTFEPVGADKTRFTVRMTYHPESFVEKARDFLGVVSRRVPRAGNRAVSRGRAPTVPPPHRRRRPSVPPCRSVPPGPGVRG
jgi:hypothetical protein